MTYREQCTTTGPAWPALGNIADTEEERVVLKLEPSAPPRAYNTHARYPWKNGRLYVWLSMEGVLDLCNGAVSEKTQQIFWPSLPAEYVTVFSKRTDAPEVRCDLTDTHSHTHRQSNYSNLPAHVRRGLIRGCVWVVLIVLSAEPLIANISWNNQTKRLPKQYNTTQCNSPKTVIFHDLTL